MTELPDIRYASTPERLYLAYTTVGDGPLDILLVGDWPMPLQERWEHPVTERPLRRLASLGRLICFDHRGLGRSDPASFSETATPERWIDDMRIVLEDCGATRPTIIATTDGGWSGILFAAQHPGRIGALVLCDTSACFLRKPEYPIGVPQELAETWFGEWNARSLDPDSRSDRVRVEIRHVILTRYEQGVHKWFVGQFR